MYSLSDDVLLLAAVFCAKPSFPFINATLLNAVMSDPVPYGTILTFVCYEGQKFENGNRIKYSSCVGSGYWNDTDMSCGCEYWQYLMFTFGKFLVPPPLLLIANHRLLE